LFHPILFARFSVKHVQGGKWLLPATSAIVDCLSTRDIHVPWQYRSYTQHSQ